MREPPLSPSEVAAEVHECRIVRIEKESVVAVNVSLAPDLIRVLQSFDKPLDESVPELIVLELYRQGRISSGKAGELLGCPAWHSFNMHRLSVFPFLI